VSLYLQKSSDYRALLVYFDLKPCLGVGGSNENSR
jgi:hypothetical protein